MWKIKNKTNLNQTNRERAYQGAYYISKANILNIKLPVGRTRPRMIGLDPFEHVMQIPGQTPPPTMIAQTVTTVSAVEQIAQPLATESRKPSQS